MADTNYELLLQCYMSGQVSEKQWVEHLKDEAFRDWFIAKAKTTHEVVDEGTDEHK